MLLNSKYINKFKRKLKNFLRQVKMGTRHTKPMAYSKSSSEGEVYNNKYLHQKRGKTSNKQTNYEPERSKNKPNLMEQKERRIIVAEINEIETKIQKIKKTESWFCKGK